MNLTSGSQTVLSHSTTAQTQTREESKEAPVTIIKLKNKPKQNVTWAEDTIDNEHMNKLKSNSKCF